MVDKVSQVMTRNPVCVHEDTPASEAARLMREHDIGTVLVTDGDGRLAGLVSDRDLVVRLLAEGGDAGGRPVSDASSRDLTSAGEDQDLDSAVARMRDKAVRRLPVVDGDNRPVGIVALGDLAVQQDPRSALALADISAAGPNG